MAASSSESAEEHHLLLRMDLTVHRTGRLRLPGKGAQARGFKGELNGVLVALLALHLVNAKLLATR